MPDNNNNNPISSSDEEHSDGDDIEDEDNRDRALRDLIVHDMWNDYIQLQHAQGLSVDDDDDDDNM